MLRRVALLAAVANAGCAAAGPTAVTKSTLVAEVPTHELMLQPRVWELDEVRRNPPHSLPRWHWYDVDQSAIRGDRETFPRDGLMLSSPAGLEPEPGGRYVVIDAGGVVGVAVATGDACPPGQPDHLPCAFDGQANGFARIDPPVPAEGLGSWAVAVGPLRPGEQPPTGGRAGLGDGADDEPYPGVSRGATISLADLDGDGEADLASTVRFEDANDPYREPCKAVYETLVRDGETWFAVEWSEPGCGASEPWSVWSQGYPAEGRLPIWIGAAALGERLLVVDRRGVLREVERVARTAQDDFDCFDSPSARIRYLGAETRAEEGPVVAIGPPDTPHARPRLVGGKLASGGVHLLPMGRSVVLYQMDLDGDSRADLDVRTQACWLSTVASSTEKTCLEARRREGTAWRTVARSVWW